MMVSTVWHTPAAIRWLQTLLVERFGHPFDLQPQPGNTRIAIHLPGDTRCITLALDGATFTRADSDLPCAQWNASAEGWHTALPGTLPAPGAAQLPMPLIAATESGWHIGYDILGLTYWMLTRQEEVGRTDLDNHGRFPATASHAYKHGYLQRPIVDEWLDVLAQLAPSIWPDISRVSHSFHLQPSHDVDFPCRYAYCSSKYFFRSIGVDLIREHSFSRALGGVQIRYQARRSTELPATDPYNTFDWIMSQSEHLGLRSHFYFLCGGHHELDPGYDPRHPAIRRLMRSIHDRGHGIGLHPSYVCVERPEQLRLEWDTLRKIAAEEEIQQETWGVRMHYLRTRYPDLWRYLDDCNVDHDASMGYADRVGFRGGTAHPYPAFDHSRQCVYKLVVIPLIVMEGTLYASSYMGLNDAKAREQKIHQLRFACESVGGQFSLLWHNSELTQQEARRTYLKGIGQSGREV